MHERILLINPAINPASQNKIINSIINTTLPTSLGSLAGFLISKGITQIRIIDEQLDFIKEAELPKLILSLQPPRIIGLSVLTINSKRAYLLAKMIKEIDPYAFIVVGGIHPTVIPKESLQCKSIDVVVRGEGEETFCELVSAVLEGKGYRNISGISYQKNGSIIHNCDRPMIINLDTIPPFPFHLFEQNSQRYSSFGVILTSRGCPYNCIFCSSRSVSGKQYRYFSIERIISEIKLLVYRYNQKIIWMMDDNIAVERIRFSKLLDAVKEARLPQDINFHGSMRGDNITEEILDKVKAINFKMISFGLETGAESLMNLINKGESVKQVIEAVNKAYQKGITVATTIIFGLPGETRRERWDTINMVHRLPLSSVRFNILTPYPGTPVFEMFNQRKEIFIKKDWENFAVQYMWEGEDLPYIPKGNNVYELIFDTMFANLSFYLSFKGLKRMIKSSFAGGNVIKFSKRWYLSPKRIWDFIRVIAYLIYRFIYIIFKMCVTRIKIKKNAKYKPIKESLNSLIDYDINKESVSTSVNDKLFYNLEQLYLEKMFENVLYEKYRDFRRPLFTYIPINYQSIHRRIRYYLQRFFRNNISLNTNIFPSWPFESSLEKVREIALTKFSDRDWPQLKKLTWAENKQYCLILTHDIESSDNWKWVRRIAGIEKELGFRSSWNVVPTLYKIDYDTLDWLIANGFEIGLHGHNHDNKMIFLPEKQIRNRIESSRHLINQYKIKGFRSPSWLRNEKLFRILQDYFIYDCSVLDVDYISATGIGGCCSVFPFRIDKIVELPTNLPYEFPVQLGISARQLNNFWSQKIDWIKKIKGAVVVITHPDSYYGGNRDMVEVYKNFLENFKQDKDLICMLPGNIAEHYNKINSRLTN